MTSGPPPRIDKYDILDVIGQGGMGIVYRAKDRGIGRLVAIKVMTGVFADDPELLQRFCREAQSAGKLQHPNILTIYEMGEVAGKPYLVMEFIDGENLDRIIRSRTELSLEDKLGLVVQICNGLQFAHEHNIVHRDIKPGNIMVARNGTAKIVDFGLAHIGAENLTHLGQVMGSISYMSPEQINGQPIDLRTDIFAAGVVLYQLLTYALPFQGSDTGSTLLKIIHEPPAPLDLYLKVPPELQNVIQRALAKDREARYSSADEFAGELTEILERLKEEKIEQRLQVVHDLMAASELDRAQEQLSQILKLDRQHRRGSELMREVRQRIQKRLTQQQAQELRHKAEEALQRHNLDDALTNLQQAVRLDGSDVELLKFRDSVQEEKTRGERIRHALHRAESAQASGELQESLKALEEVLALDPNHADAASMRAVVSNAIRERDRRKRFLELSDRARKQIAAREFQQALDTLKNVEQLDSAAGVLKELMRAASAGLQQERTQREIERLAGEIEDALNRDDYRTALAHAEQGLHKYSDDRRLQQLKTLAEKQRLAGERRGYIAEQIAAARKLIESGKTADALATVEAACRKYPVEPSLLSMRDVVKETLARETREREEAECTQKAKELLRRKQYGEAIHLLESARERLETTDLDHLIQFARDEAANCARQQKLAAATVQANRLISTEEYEPAIALLQTVLAESPDAQLQALLADVQHRVSEFTRSVADAVATAQRLISGKRIHEAVRLLEAQPQSFAKSAEFARTLEKARKQVERIQAVTLAKEQAREALTTEDFDKAVAIARACRAEVGDMVDLTLLDDEIKVRRTEVSTRRVEGAVADARTLLIGRSYRSALEILDAVSKYLVAVSAELQAQYKSVRSQASRSTGRQQEAELRPPTVLGTKDYGAGSGATMPQTHWTLEGAAAPVIPPDVAPLPRVVEAREVNIIGQGDSSSIHGEVGQTLPLGPPRVDIPETITSPLSEPAPPSPSKAEVAETICVYETQLGNVARAPVEVPRLASTQFVSSLTDSHDVVETGKRTSHFIRSTKLYWAGLALLALLAVAGVARWAGPRSAAKAPGYIEIDVLPWATVSNVVSSSGTVFPVNDQTPVRMACPPGDYDIHLTAPDGLQRTARVHVRSSKVSRYRLNIEAVDVQRILSAY